MITELTSIIKTSKSAVSLLKEIQGLIPNAKQNSEISEKILQVEKELALAESSTAKELDYNLCKCTFPPQIMLYNKEKNADICPKCRHGIKGNFAVFSD